MQVQSIPTNGNPNQTASFKAIKSIRYEGLYKKSPELGARLVESIQKNETVMNFCKKYDVNIVLYACERGIALTESSIHILYDNPAVSKIKKFFKMLGSKEDDVTIAAWSNNCHRPLEESTHSLIEHIMPYQAGKSMSGMLDAHIQHADKEIEQAMAEKAMKKRKREDVTEAKNKLSQNKSELDNAIQNLIDSTK